MGNPFDTGTYPAKTALSGIQYSARLPLGDGGALHQFVIQSATLFGVGRMKPAPGTWGSFVTLPLVFLLSKGGPILYMGVTIALIFYAIYAAEAYEKQISGHDPKEIVIDEMVGMLVTMVWLPQTWQSYLFGFLAFRFLDAVKPFPINVFDRKVGGGLGVVVDDLVAGLIASVGLQVVLYHTIWLGEQWQNF